MTQPSHATRVEHDTMGEVLVPADALYGAQTQRAVENFPISGECIERRLIWALGTIKGAAAKENAKRRIIPKATAAAIEKAAAAIADGDHDDQFPIDVFQTGSGTSSNMNTNEVIAHLADAHPNDDVNASQSSNDVFPSAIHLAAVQAIKHDLLPSAAHLERALTKKAKQFKDVVKAGRTHLMDATPVTLGQEFAGYAAQVHQASERLRDALPRVGELPLGGSAVGTGINVPKGFAKSVIAQLAADLDLPLTEARDHFAAQGARDALVGVSGDLRVLAAALTKIANDVRWLASGPRSGLGEITIPENEPGSSIMPGKVNPVLCEAVTQVAAQVVGNDAAVAFAGSQGNFELNVYLPVIARNLLQSIRLLSNVMAVFADRCIDGIEANVERCKAYAESSPAIGTALNPRLGYEKAAELVKKSVETGKSIRELVLAEKLMTDEELDRVLDVIGMTRGGR